MKTRSCNKRMKISAATYMSKSVLLFSSVLGLKAECGGQIIMTKLAVDHSFITVFFFFTNSKWHVFINNTKQFILTLLLNRILFICNNVSSHLAKLLFET